MTERSQAGTEPDAKPEFGPTGYLPARAARRARKIVLRSPLGLQWIIGAAVAGALVLGAGVLFLTSGEAPPPDPWVEVAPLEQLGASELDEQLDVLVVTAGGRVRAFADASDVAYCRSSNRLEAADGRVWALTGRGLDDTPSLIEHPTRVVSDIVYVDPTRSSPGPPTTADPVDRGCS